MNGRYYPLEFFRDYSKLAEIKDVSEFRKLVFEPLKVSWKVEIATSQEEVEAALGRDYIPEPYDVVGYPQPEAVADFKQMINVCLKAKRQISASELEEKVVQICARLSKIEEEINGFKGFLGIMCNFGSFYRLKKEKSKLLQKGAFACDWINWGFCRFGEEALDVN